MKKGKNRHGYALNTLEKPGIFIFAWMFMPFSLLMLWLDGEPFPPEGFLQGSSLATMAIAVYFFGIFILAGGHLRRLMLVTFVLSSIGELLLTEGLHLYAYRRGFVPPFVPIGHSIVYASGYLFAKMPLLANEARRLRIGFTLLFVGVFVGQWWFLNDWYTLLTGCFFFLFLKRKSWQALYFVLGLHAAWIEIWGTWFGCWSYNPLMFGFIPAANPPLGMVFFYVGGDILVARVARMWEERAHVVK